MRSAAGVVASAVLLAAVSASSAAVAAAATFGSGMNQFAIEFVRVGHPGNPPDTTVNGAGGVPYNFLMGKFEISEQMVAKANALGGLGIQHTARGSDKPVGNVNWNEAARFVNWLNTSQGFSPAYKFALQPGEAGYDSSADVALWNAGDPGYDPANPVRNRRARYFLPSGNEWYKAAFYNPGTNSYVRYATGSNAVPTAVGSGTTAGTAVYDQPILFGPADITQAGGLSFYGTMAQGGNIFEWEESQYDINNLTTGWRAVRGGSWHDPPSVLRSNFRNSLRPTDQTSSLGFRVAAVPEPSALHVIALAGLATASRWRRRSGGSGRMGSPRSR